MGSCTRTPSQPPAAAAAAARTPEPTTTVAIRAAPTPNCTQNAAAAAPVPVADAAHERNGQEGRNSHTEPHNGCFYDAVVAYQLQGWTPQDAPERVLVKCRRLCVLPLLLLLLLLLNIQGASRQHGRVQQRQRHCERRWQLQMGRVAAGQGCRFPCTVLLQQDQYYYDKQLCRRNKNTACIPTELTSPRCLAF